MERQITEYWVRVPADSPLRRELEGVGFRIKGTIGIDNFREIVTDPISEYDGEFRFGTDAILCKVIKAVEEAAGVDLRAMESMIDYPRPVAAYFDAVAAGFRLAELAVKEWGYLGPNGADETRIIDAWDSGHLDFLQAYVADASESGA